MIRYQIYRRYLHGRDGRPGHVWFPYSYRLYKARSYVERKVYHLNLDSSRFFYKVVTVEQS